MRGREREREKREERREKRERERERERIEDNKNIIGRLAKEHKNPSNFGAIGVSRVEVVVMLDEGRCLGDLGISLEGGSERGSGGRRNGVGSRRRGGGRGGGC